MKLSVYIFFISLLSMNHSLDAILNQVIHPSYQPVHDFKRSHATIAISSQKQKECPISGVVSVQSIQYINGDSFSFIQWPFKRGTQFDLFVAATNARTKYFVPYQHQ